MINPRNRFERFCYRHREKGIPNLMLYISIAAAMVYLACMITNSFSLYFLLNFDRSAILRGQVWRLFTYAFAYAHLPGATISPVLFFISLICYYSLGRAMERTWGTCKFNLYYFCGLILIDIYCMIFDGAANATHLNLSLFLGYATLYPTAQFLILFIIPVKAWVLALLNLIMSAYDVIVLPFPERLFPIIVLANYFLFFGKDVVNVVPISWRANAARLFRKKSKATGGTKSKPIPFPDAGSYAASTATVKAPYTHCCSICGRTDVSDPDLEFRYCSRCSGYRCYCEHHINNHAHQ